MARLKGFERLTSIDEALFTFLAKLRVTRLKSTRVPIEAALGRVTAEDVVADYDLPCFDRSAVDGYAVKAQDTFEAAQFNPKTLGMTENEEIRENEAQRIWTGNLLPRGANAVVMLEHTKRMRDGIEMWKPVTPGENVSKKGEDISQGDLAIGAGTRLKPQHMGLLAALGLTHVDVVINPKVAILSTGNELVEQGCKAQPGQVVDVNRLILSSMCSALGAEALDLGIATDDAKEIETKILEGLKEANVVITTGGTSLGYDDLVPLVASKIDKLGVIVHGIAMRPGMPTGLGILRGKPLFMLSGNPVAAMIGFEAFVRPIILKLLGIEHERRPMLKARLTHRVASALGRRVFLRVQAYEKDGEFFADPVRIRGSGILSTMTKANGYVMIPEDREGLEKGESVVVHLFDEIGVA